MYFYKIFSYSWTNKTVKFREYIFISQLSVNSCLYHLSTYMFPSPVNKVLESLHTYNPPKEKHLFSENPELFFLLRGIFPCPLYFIPTNCGPAFFWLQWLQIWVSPSLPLPPILSLHLLSSSIQLLWAIRPYPLLYPLYILPFKSLSYSYNHVCRWLPDLG